MLANPPFGVEWKQQEREIKWERNTLGHEARFGAGIAEDQRWLTAVPAAHAVEDAAGGQRGAAAWQSYLTVLRSSRATRGAGESNIRRWIIENDWLEAMVALPDQLFYNTGISTYIWVLTNRKEPHRAGEGAAHRRAASSS